MKIKEGFKGLDKIETMMTRHANWSNIILESHLSRWGLIIYSVLNFIFSILIILFEKMVSKFSGRNVSCVVRLKLLGMENISA